MIDQQLDFFLEKDGTTNFDKSSNGEWKIGKHPSSKNTQFKSGNTKGGRTLGALNNKTTQGRTNLSTKEDKWFSAAILSNMNKPQKGGIGELKDAARTLVIIFGWVVGLLTLMFFVCLGLIVLCPVDKSQRIIDFISSI